MKRKYLLMCSVCAGGSDKRKKLCNSMFTELFPFLKKRCVRDSNPWPHAWQACILTNWTNAPCFVCCNSVYFCFASAKVQHFSLLPNFLCIFFQKKLFFFSRRFSSEIRKYVYDWNTIISVTLLQYWGNQQKSSLFQKYSCNLLITSNILYEHFL